MSVSNAQGLELISTSSDRTRQLGAQLGRALQPGDVICLQGDLGAGKTTFVQGMAEGWGSIDSASSPTFVLVNLYRRVDGAQMYHLDAYRLESTREAEDLDLDFMMMHGVLVIEWPERLLDLIPPQRLWINFDHLDEDQRAMRISANGARYEQLVSGMA